MVSFHCRLLFITLTRNYEASSLRIILTVFICSFSNLRFSLNAVLNVSLFTQTEKILSYVYVWLDSIFLEVEIPAELCFIKALLVVLSLFFLGGTRPSVTSGKIKMRDCFVLKGRRMKNFSFSLTLSFFDFLRAFFSSA